MKKRAFAIWALSSVAVFLTLLFQAQVPAAAVEKQLAPEMLTVELESDKPAYQAGEPIKIRISIKNTGDGNYSLPAVPSWALCSLMILDGNNSLLQSSGLQVGYRITTAGKTYPAHSTHAIEFNDPYGEHDIVEWAPVSVWGYSLSKAGTYTITAIAKFTATAVSSPPYQQFAVTETSNSVRIKVLR